MTTDNIRLRNEFINTQVITRNTGKKLGVVKDILIDIDQREVVALGLRDNFLSLSGMPQYMLIDSISQIGDVVLVESEDVIETIDLDAYTPLINSEVITESGEPLGRVRDFQFDLGTGKVNSLIIASLGFPQIPDQLISTYEIGIEEVISSGPNRLIVFEGSEERLVQLTVGVLERIGLGRAPWEKDEEELYYPPTTRPENQLGTGIPLRTPIQARPQPAIEERWDEDDRWEEEPIAVPVRQRAETIRYQEYEEEDELEADNWGEVEREPVPRYEDPRSERDYAYDNVDEDIWEAEPEPYNPPKINIPEKQKAPEYYEEEAG